MLQAIAIDDEPVALEVIRQLAKAVAFINLQAVFTNPHTALTYLEQHKVDLLFLDIRMPDISGMELLKKVQYRPLTIFTTAYSEHAVQSFELDAVDYLLKPFSADRFLKACQKANELFQLRNSQSGIAAYILIKTGYDQVRVKLDDLLYVQSAGNYVQFVLTDQKLLSRLTITETEALLPSSAFTRIHRSYIVANRRITRLEKNTVYCDDIALPIGSGYISLLERAIKRI